MPDATPCHVCADRHAERLHLLATVKVEFAGTARCTVCGQEYPNVLVIGEPVDDHGKHRSFLCVCGQRPRRPLGRGPIKPCDSCGAALEYRPFTIEDDLLSARKMLEDRRRE